MLHVLHSTVLKIVGVLWGNISGKWKKPSGLGTRRVLCPRPSTDQLCHFSTLPASTSYFFHCLCQLDERIILILRIFGWIITNIPPDWKKKMLKNKEWWVQVFHGTLWMTWGQVVKVKLQVECIYPGGECRDWVGLGCVSECLPTFKAARSCLTIWSHIFPGFCWADCPVRRPEGAFEKHHNPQTFTSVADSYFSGMELNRWPMGIPLWLLQKVFLGPSQRQRCKLMCLLSLHLHWLSHAPSGRKSRT